MNIFENRVFMPGDLVRKTKGPGGKGTQWKKNIWRILEIKYNGTSRKGPYAKLELVEGCLTDPGNGNKKVGPGFRYEYYLQHLSHVEEGE